MTGRTGKGDSYVECPLRRAENSRDRPHRPVSKRPVTEDLHARRLPCRSVDPTDATRGALRHRNARGALGASSTRDETRTRKPRRVGDFESPASTDSATRAGRQGNYNVLRWRARNASLAMSQVFQPQTRCEVRAGGVDTAAACRRNVLRFEPRSRVRANRPVAVRLAPESSRYNTMLASVAGCIACG